MTSPPPTPELVTFIIEIINSGTAAINSLTAQVGTPQFDTELSDVLFWTSVAEDFISIPFDIVCG